MIKKEDLLLLLTEMQAIEKDNVEITKQIRKLMTSKEVPLETLSYINTRRPLDATKFYNMLRDNYNNKKSKLYINIVKEVEDPQECLSTLSALMLQIILFSRRLENKQLFFQHTRANYITKVLSNYFKTFDITACIKLLKYIKADIICLEYTSGRRKID